MKAAEKENPSPVQFQTRLTQFFNSCKTKKLSKVQLERQCLPIYIRFLKQEFGFTFSVLFGVGVIVLLINSIPWINWTLCAVGRLILIELLPYWKWTDLYDKQCLWEPNKGVPETFVFNKPLIDCSICERFGKYLGYLLSCSMQINYSDLLSETIPRLPSLPSYDDLENPYLPVVFPYEAEMEEESLMDILFNKIPNHRTCGLRTSLLFNRKATLQDLKKMTTKSQSFFFSFRFCNSESVKQSRRIDSRPTFFPSHLPPAYSSWILVARNYTSNRKVPLLLEGLTFVRQIEGSTEMQLFPKSDCDNVCPEVPSIHLEEGEGLLFFSDLWDFAYSPTTAKDTSSTSFITETEMGERK